MSARILVVEDETVIARDIQKTLRKLGYVVPAPIGSGAQILEAVASQHPDLVLMDIRIRGDIDGIQAAALLRERQGPPVVYLTAHSDEATVARAKATGAYGYVLKPFTDRDLRTAIEVALEKRELEQQLAARERWFATTLRSIGDAVIATDMEQRITFMNAVAEQVTGWSAADAAGKALGEILPLVDEKTGAPLESPLARAFRRGFAVELPPFAALSRKAGEVRAIDDTAAPIIADDGETLGGVVVFRDVTERRRIEERLVQTEHLAAIGTLAAGMAHEVNTPLAYSLANITFALECLADTKRRLSEPGGDTAVVLASLDEIAVALVDAREGSQRVNRIVQDLKRFGRVDVADRSLVELSEILESAIRFTHAAVRQHARVRREYKTTPFVDANDSQLGQVFINLLVNAAQALGEGDAATREIVVATYTDEGGRAVAEVRDTGPGIPADVRRRIFDPFFTTKPVGQGTGLGLSISQSIVRSLGGDITVESAVGQGTVFRVALPAAQKRGTAPFRADGPAAATRRGRVLVIDDEPAIGRALCRLLEREHDVFAVTDPRDALPRIAAGESFDVIFCDLMMPAMSGIDFFDAVRATKPDVARRIVFVTGGAFTPGAEEFMRTTSNKTLVKPVDPVDLRRTVAAFVDARQGDG